jgi:putative peptidoglycan lipid II flippase
MTDTHADRPAQQAAPAPAPRTEGADAGGPRAEGPPRGDRSPSGEPPRLGRFLARAAAVTAGLSAVGSLFGLLRDQTIAQLFGADAATDAFLVAWTVPELAATVLIEDAMALILVPAFSLALSRRTATRTGHRVPVAAGGGGGPEAEGPGPQDVNGQGLDGQGLDVQGLETKRPQTERLDAGNLEAGNLEAGNLEARHPQRGAPESEAAEGEEPEGAAPETTGPDPVWQVVRRTLPRLMLALAACAAALVVAAPLAVRLLAPGLPDSRTAVDCMRLTSLTVVSFGLAGYFSAALRAHRHYTAPAAIYVAYNAGIIAVMFAGHTQWGVRAAALGVAIGGLLMVVIQLPSFLARMPSRAARRGTVRPSAGRRRPAGGMRGGRASTVALLGLGTVSPVITFALIRQAQVLYERFLASSLPAGAISHLNYAQKVAQMPMVFSLMVCTVTFPVVARAMADGDPEGARRRVERDLALVGIVVLLGASYVIACAPQIIHLLFERGAFDARDTSGTASVMRVYSVGLLGQGMVGALIRPFFSATRPTWYPAGAMGAGLVVTVAAGALAVGPWGVYGIAAANALGITATALLLLRGLGARVIAIDGARVAVGLLRLLLAAGAAAAAGWAVAEQVPGALLGSLAGGVVVLIVFASMALLLRAPEVPQLFATVKKRLAHVR